MTRLRLTWTALVLVAAVGAITAGILGHSRSAAAASKDAVDCSEVSMSFDAKSPYEVNCEKMSESLAGLSGTVAIQHLEATANDSSAFIDAREFVFTGRVIYTAMDLRTNLKNFYGDLSPSNWESGRVVSKLSTAQFKAEMRGLPSHCVAFQKLAHPEWNGYKKLMIGVSCSQDNIDQAYDVLKRLYLPD